MDTVDTHAITTMTIEQYTRQLITSEEFFNMVEKLVDHNKTEMPLPRWYLDNYQLVKDTKIAVQVDEIDIGNLPREFPLVSMLTFLYEENMMPTDLADGNDIEKALSSDWVIFFGFGEADPEIKMRDGNDIAMWWKDLNTIDKKISLPGFLESMTLDEMGETYVYKDGKQTVVNVGFIIWTEDKAFEGEKQ